MSKDTPLPPPPIDISMRRTTVPRAPEQQAELPNDLPKQNQTKTAVSYDINYSILGENSQYVEIKLRPGQTVTGEISALMYFDTGINMKLRASSSLQDDSGGVMAKFLRFGKAALSGQKLFMMSFTNTTQKELKIAFSMPYSGNVLALDMAKIGGEILCQNDSFLCASSTLKINNATTQDLGANFISYINTMQKITGNGILFLFAGGSCIERRIIPGEVVNVTTGVALAMQTGINFKNKTIKNVGFGGKGHFLTEISGTGNVWLQSMPYSIIKKSIIEQIGSYFGIKKKKGNAVWGNAWQ